MNLLLMATGDIVTVCVAGGVIFAVLIVALAGGFKGASRAFDAYLKKKKEERAAKKRSAAKDGESDGRQPPARKEEGPPAEEGAEDRGKTSVNEE